MKTETQQHEQLLAEAWYDTVYTEKQAKRSCELQGINFDNVKEIYGNLYRINK